MSRIPIASLANGVLFATQTFASPSNPSGVPVLTPAVGTQCFVYIHDTATPAAIWTDELGSVPLAQPLTTSVSGTVPGWIDTSLLPLDLVVALPSGNEVFVLAGGGGAGGGGAVGSVFGRTGSITAQTGDYTASQVGADAAGAAAAVTSALSTETARAQTAEALLAPKASPALTGTPTVPTATPLTNTSQAASTAYADAAVAVEKSRALAAEFAPTTKRLTTGIGAVGTQFTTAVLDVVTRHLMMLPVTPTRFRLRYANYNSFGDGAGAGSLNFLGAAIGPPAYPTTNSGRWIGQYASAPTVIASAGTTPASAQTDYVTPWVTNTGLITANQMFCLSMGINSGGASVVYIFDGAGAASGLIGSQFTGAGCSANFAAQGTPAGGAFVQNQTTGDWRLEYEYTTSMDSGRPAVPVVMAIGDSITQGFCSTNQNGVLSGAMPHEAWPVAAGLKHGFAVANLGIGSTRASASNSTLTSWMSGTDDKWTRCAAWADADLGSADGIPDACVILLGSNDIALDTAAATTVITAMETIIGKVQAIGVTKIYLGTIVPRALSGTQETIRNTVNAWIREVPFGCAGVFDFDKVMQQNGGLIATTATLVSGAGGNPVTVASVGAGIIVGAQVYGSTGIPAATTVTAVSGTSITLSNNPNASGAANLYFQNPNNFFDPDLGNPNTGWPHPFLAGYQRMADIVHI